MTHPIWVKYTPVDSSHEHLLMLSDGTIGIGELLEELDDCANEFATQVERCNGDRHGSHGQTHSHADVEEAYRIAKFQLLTTDYGREWEGMEQDIRAWKKWQGPVPAAVLQVSADDPNQDELLVTDREGNLYKRDLNQKVLTNLLPSPEEYGGKPNKDGLGWTMPPKEK